MITGKIHSWNPDCKFSQNPHISIMKKDFPLIKIKLLILITAFKKKKMFNNIPHTKSCTSYTSSTSCGTLVYKGNDTPNDFVVNTTSKLSDQLVRGKKPNF